MATKTIHETITTSAPAANGSDASSNDKRTKLGWCSLAKFSSTVGAKNVTEWQKKSAEASEARAAAQKLKEQMTEAVAKKLNVKADELDVSIQEDRAVFYKRPDAKPRKAKVAEKELSL